MSKKTRIYSFENFVTKFCVKCRKVINEIGKERHVKAVLKISLEFVLVN